MSDGQPPPLCGGLADFCLPQFPKLSSDPERFCGIEWVEGAVAQSAVDQATTRGKAKFFGPELAVRGLTFAKLL
jgi:hypothetical protein